MRTQWTLLSAGLAFLLGGCGWILPRSLPPADLFTPGEEYMVSGVMIGSRDDCFVDGLCSIILDVDGATVEAIWNEGMTDRPCVGILCDDLQMGDPVEAYGEAVSSNALSICPSERYFIRETINTPVEPGG
jgi:hypothetical protein